MYKFVRCSSHIIIIGRHPYPWGALGRFHGWRVRVEIGCQNPRATWWCRRRSQGIFLHAHSKNGIRTVGLHVFGRNVSGPLVFERSQSCAMDKKDEHTCIFVWTLQSHLFPSQSPQYVGRTDVDPDPKTISRSGSICISGFATCAAFGRCNRDPQQGVSACSMTEL